MSTRPVDTFLVVGEHLLECHLSLSDTRLLDHLNDPRTEFLQAREARLLHRPYDGTGDALGDAVVPKSRVRLAIPSALEHEAPEKRFNTRAMKRQHPALILVGSLELRGDLHVQQDADLARLLVHDFGRFIPLTEVTVSNQGRPIQFPEARVVFVNKQYVDTIHASGFSAPTTASDVIKNLRQLIEA